MLRTLNVSLRKPMAVTRTKLLGTELNGQKPANSTLSIGMFPGALGASSPSATRFLVRGSKVKNLLSLMASSLDLW